MNPLAQFSRNEVLQQIDDFANEMELTDFLPVLRKGALVARNPAAFESVEELDENERMALENEVLHKWRQPKALYLTVVICSVGAAVQQVLIFSDVWGA